MKKNFLEEYKKSIDLFKKYRELYTLFSTQENQLLYTSMRDSMIQRFKRNVIFLWKALTIYLQDTGVNCLATLPCNIIQEAVNVKILSESQGIRSMNMINIYNQTSLIYDTISPDDIAQQILNQYDLMKEIIDRIQYLKK